MPGVIHSRIAAAQNRARNRNDFLSIPEKEDRTEGLDESIETLTFKDLQTYAKDHEISAAGSRQGILSRIKAALGGE